MDRMYPIARIDLGVNLLLDGVNCISRENSRMSHAQNEPQQVLTRFDNRIISLPAVKKAAYKYINSFAVDFSLKNNDILCSLTFTAPTTEELSLKLVEDFKKEALDQDLREQIKTETEPIRNLIFALAFSRTGIVGNEQVPKD